MTNDKPLVSVLIPCFNGQNYINKCLKSCTEQSYRNIEIIVLNDGSTDNSLDILNAWAQRDKRIKVFTQENKGLGESRNILINLCETEYFTFLDIDDFLPHKAIEWYVNNSNNLDADIVVGKSIIVFGNIKLPFLPTWRYTRNMTNGHFIKSNICPPWGSMIKTSYFKSLNVKFIEGRVFEDIGVMTYVFLSAKKFKAINKIVYHYHQNKKLKNNSSLSSFNSQCFKKINDVYFQTKQILSLLDKHHEFKTKEYKRYINGLFFQIIPIIVYTSANMTNDELIKYICRYNIIDLIRSFGYKIKFSKSSWKSLTYFFINTRCNSALKDLDNEIYNSSFRSKKYKYIQKIQEKNNDYDLIKIESLNDLEQEKISRRIYEIELKKLTDINELSKYKKFSLAVRINKDSNKDEIIKKLKEIANKDLTPYLVIDYEINYNTLKELSNYVMGVIFDASENKHNFINLKHYLKTKQMKVAIFLITKNAKDLKNKTYDRVFIKQ